MAHPTAVILVVGLTESLLGEHTPNLSCLAADGAALRHLKPVLPAVTCSVQSSMLTGVPPREHGIVGNGWYDRESAEVRFWKQSNHLVQAEKVWETARMRDPSVTTLNMFWWYNMYSSAEWSVTPRPIYKADGRKIPDVYSDPPELGVELQRELGRFPLFHFWGPATSIASSRWITSATIAAHQKHEPTLTLVYLPHLDYALQKLGPQHPDIPKVVREVDVEVGRLIEHFRKTGTRIMVVSEYGIEPVSEAIHINRILRENGALRVREEEGLELLDCGASRVFAVADHQIAHVYVRDPGDVERYRELCQAIPGVAQVLSRADQAEYGIDHERSGELVLIAESGRWFSYYYWLDDAKAPDFARCVEIHRKPGYDPVELFLDPSMAWPQLKIAAKLLRKKLGFRTLMDVIPLDASLVRGSHGTVDLPLARGPIMLTSDVTLDLPKTVECTAVRDVILAHLFDG